MKRQVAIIGAGRVGSSIAISTLLSGLADEVLLHDVKGELAVGEVMDLAHGATFYPAATVRTASIEEMIGADAIVVTAGRGGRPGESRLDLLRDNAAVIGAIGRQLTGCSGTIILVSNPVDVLTYVMTHVTGLPPSRVLGTGTMLDTARLRHVLGELLDMDPHSIHAHVVGEHGDSEVVLWSSASIGGVAIRDWPGWDTASESVIAERVRRAADEIIQRKGVTNHAIGLVTADLLRSLLRGERRVLTVSRVQEGALGLRDVALSLPAVVGREGAEQIFQPEMSPDERERLERSAGVLRDACRNLIAR
jgi:L-lactate dehydrogenase